MDTEQVLFRLHARCAALLTPILTPKLRRVILLLMLINALGLMILLWVMHALYVSDAAQPNCLTRELIQTVEQSGGLDKVDIVEINIASSWLRLRAQIERQVANVITRSSSVDASEALLSVIREQMRDAKIGKPSRTRRLANAFQSKFGKVDDTEDISHTVDETSNTVVDDKLQSENVEKLMLAWLDELEADTEADWWVGNATFRFANERGLLSLSLKRANRLGLKRVNVFVPDGCTHLGADHDMDGRKPGAWPWHGLIHRIIPTSWKPVMLSMGELILEQWVGYDTPVVNSVAEAFRGSGFLQSHQTHTTYSLSYAREVAWFQGDIEASTMLKVGTLCSAFFLLFALSSLVSFILGETQNRMMRFTLALHRHVRDRLPLAPLIISHSVESVVFVPIMLGVLFFLFEFFSDQLLAFLVLLALWQCEVFSVLVCRTAKSVTLFPRVFVFSFLWFLCYYLYYPFGFHYLALLACIACVDVAMFYSWHAYELPALADGLVSSRQPREAPVTALMNQTSAPRTIRAMVNIELLLRRAPQENNQEQEGGRSGNTDRRNRAGTAPAPVSTVYNEHANRGSTTRSRAASPRRTRAMAMLFPSDELATTHDSPPTSVVSAPGTRPTSTEQSTEQPEAPASQPELRNSSVLSTSSESVITEQQLRARRNMHVSNPRAQATSFSVENFRSNTELIDTYFNYARGASALAIVNHDATESSNNDDTCEQPPSQEHAAAATDQPPIANSPSVRPQGPEPHVRSALQSRAVEFSSALESVMNRDHSLDSDSESSGVSECDKTRVPRPSTTETRRMSSPTSVHSEPSIREHGFSFLTNQTDSFATVAPEAARNLPRDYSRTRALNLRSVAATATPPRRGILSSPFVSSLSLVSASSAPAVSMLASITPLALSNSADNQSDQAPDANEPTPAPSILRSSIAMLQTMAREPRDILPTISPRHEDASSRTSEEVQTRNDTLDTNTSDATDDEHAMQASRYQRRTVSSFDVGDRAWR